MSGHPSSGSPDGMREAIHKEATATKAEAGSTTAVKAELTVQHDLFRSSYSTVYEIQKEEVASRRWNEEAYKHSLPTGVKMDFHPQDLQQGIVKMEDNIQVDTRKPSSNDLHPASTHADARQEQRPIKKEEEEASVHSPTTINTQAFLNFETEEDKHIKVKPQHANEQSSRAGSSEASTSSSRSASEEADIPARKPGLPVSIKHLPVANKEALATFDELDQCIYQNKQMGLAHQQEDSMSCDCIFDPETDDLDIACGESSGCINRLTQVECVAGDCRCKGYCRNQRFQKRQYAPIDIVQTEKKGFGVRAREDLEANAFVYEYIGEIIGEKAFQKRMRDYFEEGIEHFYFMMLQKDEFLDATKRGGKGRFLNHSCAPNCYVAKWVVGRRLRMGIFTKRRIQANEELTFNYNVDRYGHDAQECFCGEPNCVGFIGGKTQTDIAGMDDLYLDALGITDAVDALGLKGSKKKKSRKLDEDYFPELTPIPLPDVPKVSSALRQAASNRRIISKLLERILLTEEVNVQRALLRLHGFSLMSTILREHPEDTEISISVLGVLAKWPLITRNKLISTNIEPTVMSMAEKQDQPTIAEPAKLLLQMWQALEVGYRIPKSMQETIDAEGPSRKRPAQDILDEIFVRRNRLRIVEDAHVGIDAGTAALTRTLESALARGPSMIRPKRAKTPPPPPPPNWEVLPAPQGSVFQEPVYQCVLTKATYEYYPSEEEVQYELDKYNRSLQVDVIGIIAKARAEAQAKAAMEASVAQAEAEAARLAKKTKQEQRIKKESQSKEKKMYRLFSTVVIKTMSKYKKYLDNESFKKRAKEVCKIMCDKEKKSSHFETDKYDELSPEKESKLRKYVKEFMTKLLTRKGIKVSSTSTTTTPSSDRKRPSKSQQSKDAMLEGRGGPTNHSPSRMSLPTPETPSNEADGDENDMDLEDDEDDDLINEIMDGAGGIVS